MFADFGTHLHVNRTLHQVQEERRGEGGCVEKEKTGSRVILKWSKLCFGDLSNFLSPEVAFAAVATSANEMLDFFFLSNISNL